MSYVGAAANVVGGIMQGIASSQEQKAMFGAFQDEIRRQQGYGRQAHDIWRPSLDQRSRETADKQMAAGAQAREGLYGGIANRPLAPGMGGFSPVDRAKFDLSGQQRANVGSISDWQLNQWINNLRTQQDLDKVSNFAQGTAQVFPYRMYEAQHSMDELAFWGNLISSIGGGGGNMQSAFGGSGPPTSGLTGAQQGAFSGGMGPVSAPYAQQLYQQQPLPYPYNLSMGQGGSQYLPPLQ